MKARDYLIGKGLAVPGRGKFSFEAKEELQKALSQGITFEDWDSDGSSARRRKPRRVVICSEKRVKPKVQPLRQENRLRITDSFGVTMDLEFCSLGHEIKMCSCKTVYAPVHFNAVKSQLVTI